MVGRPRRRLIGALAPLLAVGLLSVPAVGATDRADDRTKNLEQIEQVPIAMGKEALAQGSDLAFRGNLIVAGAYEGAAFFRSSPQGLKQVSFYDCPGSQGDVSVWRNLVFISVDSATSNIGDTPLCNNTATNRNDSSLEKEGVRIVDISNLQQPRQVGFIETDCGSHTHTLAPAPHGNNLFMYVNSYPLTSGQGVSCNQASHRKFSIVKINTHDPSKSDVVNTHALPPDTVGCHDTTVFPKRNLAIAACLGVWLTMDITKPARPKTLAETRNPAIELDHSSAITWDGKIAIIGDEHAGAAGGGGCSPDSSSPIGAMWFYDITDPKAPELLASHSLPRVPSVDTADDAQRFRCTTHNFNVVPMKDPKKYIVVASYYSGGIAAIDFSDPENPKEIAHYVNEEDGVNPDTWAAYWYNGRIYTNDHGSKFGIGVYELDGTARSDARYFKGGMNPQLQVARFR